MKSMKHSSLNLQQPKKSQLSSLQQSSSVTMLPSKSQKQQSIDFLNQDHKVPQQAKETFTLLARNQSTTNHHPDYFQSYKKSIDQLINYNRKDYLHQQHELLGVHTEHFKQIKNKHLYSNDSADCPADLRQSLVTPQKKEVERLHEQQRHVQIVKQLNKNQAQHSSSSLSQIKQQSMLSRAHMQSQLHQGGQQQLHQRWVHSENKAEAVRLGAHSQLQSQSQFLGSSMQKRSQRQGEGQSTAFSHSKGYKSHLQLHKPLHKLPHTSMSTSNKIEQQKQCSPYDLPDPAYQSTQSILQNARKEQENPFMKHGDQADKIQSLYQELNVQCDRLVEDAVKKQVNDNRNQYMHNFKKKMTEIQQQFLDLEKERVTEENVYVAQKKLNEKIAVRNMIREQNDVIDRRCKAKEKELKRLKDVHSEREEQKTFLQEQIEMAKYNQVQLKLRINLLQDEIEQVKQSQEEQRDFMSNGHNQATDEMAQERQRQFQFVMDKLKRQVNYLKNRNDNERNLLVHRQLKNSKSLVDVSMPYESFWRTAVQETKKEIVIRNFKSQQSNKRAVSRKRAHIGTGQMQNDKMGLEIDKEVKNMEALQSFSETDKIQVMNKFMNTEEVKYLIYGMLFPNKTQMLLQEEHQKMKSMTHSRQNSQESLQSINSQI